MKPLVVLLVAFILSVFLTRIFDGEYDYTLAGRIAMSAMLVFTAIAHFAFTKGMAMMLPSFFPYKNFFVYLTGLMEIAAAAGLLIPGIQMITAWLLILFFMLILPANIYAAIKKIDYQKADFDGKGIAYLWFRVPLQLFFMAWTYLSAIYVS